jgi:hypothetical protein
MAERSDLIRGEIEETRAQMGDTIDALGYKANVPARAKGWVSDKKDTVVSTVTGVTPDRQAIKQKSLLVKDTAERNPLGLAIAGAAAGFLAGMFTPSTRVEDEKLGPVSDQIKSTAAEAGQEALQHGAEVAQAAAQSAVETAKDEGKQHGEELSASVQEKARDVSPTDSQT